MCSATPHLEPKNKQTENSTSSVHRDYLSEPVRLFIVLLVSRTPTKKKCDEPEREDHLNSEWLFTCFFLFSSSFFLPSVAAMATTADLRAELQHVQETIHIQACEFAQARIRAAELAFRLAQAIMNSTQVGYSADLSEISDIILHADEQALIRQACDAEKRVRSLCDTYYEGMEAAKTAALVLAMKATSPDAYLSSTQGTSSTYETSTNHEKKKKDGIRMVKYKKMHVSSNIHKPDEFVHASHPPSHKVNSPVKMMSAIASRMAVDAIASEPWPVANVSGVKEGLIIQWTGGADGVCTILHATEETIKEHFALQKHNLSQHKVFRERKESGVFCANDFSIMIHSNTRFPIVATEFLHFVMDTHNNGYDFPRHFGEEHCMKARASILKQNNTWWYLSLQGAWNKMKMLAAEIAYRPRRSNGGLPTMHVRGGVSWKMNAAMVMMRTLLTQQEVVPESELPEAICLAKKSNTRSESRIEEALMEAALVCSISDGDTSSESDLHHPEAAIAMAE